MKAYLIITGGLFGLLAVAHFLRTALEWSRLGSDPWFVVQGPGIGLIALVLCLWSQKAVLEIEQDLKALILNSKISKI